LKPPPDVNSRIRSRPGLSAASTIKNSRLSGRHFEQAPVGAGMSRRGRRVRRARWSPSPEIGEIVKGIVARKKFVSLCTNALLREKKQHLFEPSPYLFFSLHLDGLKQHHDKSVCMEGGFEKAVSAIKAAKVKGFA
jgi:hypothetical protein